MIDINSPLYSAQNFSPNPLLPEKELANWESHQHINLPEEYRLFLTNIGNGGKIPGQYCNFEIYPLEKTYIDTNVHTPLPIDHKSLEKHIKTSTSLKKPIELPELEPFQEESLPGCIQIGIYPGGDGILLIISGELQGTIWNTVENGLPELDANKQIFRFGDWLVDVLIESKTW